MKSQVFTTWRLSRDAVENSPSRACGVSVADERALRRAGSAQIVLMATELFGPEKWRGPATTGIVLFQRFFSRQSFMNHERWTAASACLFLASKVEELHRKAREVLGKKSWGSFVQFITHNYGTASNTPAHRFQLLNGKWLPSLRCAESFIPLAGTICH
jgi:hypothetical protein